MTPKPPQKRAIYFVPRRAFNPSYNIYGLTWKVRSEGSSFYFICRHEMNDRKISLHGPSTAHPGTSWFKIALDKTSGDGVARSQLLPYGNQEDRPLSFPGRTIKNGVKHVIRFRWTADLFQLGAPPTYHPGKIKERKTQKAVWLEAPPPNSALDVDFFLSKGAPYIPHPNRAREDNAVLGPQINEIGQSLTGVAYRHDLRRHPTPEPLGGLRLPEITDIWEWRRALQVFGDPRGFLHVQERLVPGEQNTENGNARQTQAPWEYRP